MFQSTGGSGAVENGSCALSEGSRHPGRRRVLVVDDTALIREPLSMSLRDRGYEVTCAANGREAMDALTRIRPDMILLDISMPVMDGMTFLRLLRQDDDPARRDLPVIMMTASSTPDRVREAYRLGVKDYMDKSEVSLLTF